MFEADVLVNWVAAGMIGTAVGGWLLRRAFEALDQHEVQRWLTENGPKLEPGRTTQLIAETRRRRYTVSRSARPTCA